MIHLLSSLALAIAVCAPATFAASIQAPASIAGATIKLDEGSFSPSDISIIKYIPQDGKAQLIMHYEKQIMPRIHVAGALSGAKTNDEVYGKDVKPAIVTFTGKKGNTYHGTVEGSWAASQSYRGEESRGITMLKNKDIKIILPDDKRPQTGTVKAPEIIQNGALIQIQTDKRILHYQLGKNGASRGRYTPRDTTATMEFILPDDAGSADVSLHASGEDVFQEAMTASAASPRIVFLEKSGNTYKGGLHGYLYGYKTNPELQEPSVPDFIFLFKEKLIGITITLP